jgi:hypothetical protein
MAETAEEIDLKVTTSGIDSRTMKWSDIGLKQNNATVTIYPISSLPSEPAGQANAIDDRYANGLIDKRTYDRLLAWGDMPARDKYVNAEADLIETTLDEICRTKKFIAPEQGVQDPTLCLSMAKARYNLEKRFKAPKKVLRAIQQYMAVAADYIANPSGSFLPPAITPPQPAPAMPAAAGPPGLGAPPPQAMLPAMGTPANPETPVPAPPPVQVAPPMAAPPTV